MKKLVRRSVVSALDIMFVRYGMVVNPDTGAVPSYADSMLKELLGPSSGPIRQEALLDEPVLRAFCKRNRVLG